MKNIKLILFSLTLIFASCGDDTYSIEYTDTEVKQDLAVSSLTLDRERVAATSSARFTVTIENAFSVDATVTVASVNKCGGPISHLAETSSSKVVIKAGETSASGTITIADLNAEMENISWDGALDCFSFELTGIALAEGDDPYVASSFSVPATLTQPDPGYMGDPDADAVMISMDWKNPGANDFDLYVTNPASSIIEFSESGSRFEGDFFDNDTDTYYPAPDGEYLVWFAPYIQEASDVPGEIYFTHPVTGNVDVVSFVAADGTRSWPPTPVAVITKSTDADGNMSYEIAAY